MLKSAHSENIAAISLQDPMIFLHELRTRELRAMPPDARIVLSAGCSSPYYFQWFADNYPNVRWHIGVEAYATKPANLPANVEWIASSISDMKPVKDGSTDLLFAGQVIEHLWPEEVAGFLCEARRVLRNGGRLVIDSPNRLITEALNWRMPEHTAEFTVDEMVELLKLAGFQNLQVKGLWLCYDREQHRFLPLSPTEQIDEWTWQRRLEYSAARPEDCFVWWIEAESGNFPTNHALIEQRAWEICHRFQSLRQQQLYSAAGQIKITKSHKLVSAAKGESGYLIYGPYVPLQSGSYRATFSIRADELNPSFLPAGTAICTLDCHESATQRILSDYQVKAEELNNQNFAQFSLLFTLNKPAFGVEFRLNNSGAIPLTALFNVLIEEI